MMSPGRAASRAACRLPPALTVIVAACTADARAIDAVRDTPSVSILFKCLFSCFRANAYAPITKRASRKPDQEGATNRKLAGEFGRSRVELKNGASFRIVIGMTNSLQPLSKAFYFISLCTSFHR